jgi:hypothetical protein
VERFARLKHSCFFGKLGNKNSFIWAEWSKWSGKIFLGVENVFAIGTFSDLTTPSPTDNAIVENTAPTTSSSTTTTTTTAAATTTTSSTTPSTLWAQPTTF